MATKTGILATINSFLTAIITQAKVRSASSTIVDEIYSVGVSDSNVTETYTTKNGTNVTYRITIKKQGNEVTIKGNLTNTTASALPVQSIFTFKDTEFKPKTETGNLVKFRMFNQTNEVICQINSSGFNSLQSIPANSTFDFQSINYIAQD
jgi:hypothetical protein